MGQNPDATEFVSPQDFELPHSEWRPYQRGVLKLLVAKKHGTTIISAATGSGKSAWAAGLSKIRRVISLTKTKLLQEFNYAGTYNFQVLYGKSNYPCTHSMARYWYTAEDCMDYKTCNCKYALDKQASIESSKASYNYALWLSNQHWIRNNLPDTLFLDEAHQLPEITIEHAGISISEKTRSKWNLPPFPDVSSSIFTAILPSSQTKQAIVINWLSKCITHMEKIIEKHRFHKTPKEAQIYRNAKYMSEKFTATHEALFLSPTDWYIESNLANLICKPLTARYHFRTYFTNCQQTILVSATIGNAETLAKELGIENYLYHKVPNQWPPQTRPVRVLDVPGMGRKAFQEPKRFEKQADEIAKAILEYPPDWEGVIHVTRKTESELLAKRLAKRGLGERVWVPPGAGSDVVGTNTQMKAWEIAKKKKTGAIAIAWSWWEGVDLRDEKISICAKTPFPDLSNKYERARMKFSGTTYLWRTAVQLHQGLGRTRRGNPDDYDTQNEKRGLVAIADGNWNRIKKYLDEEILDSLEFD